MNDIAVSYGKQKLQKPFEDTSGFAFVSYFETEFADRPAKHPGSWLESKSQTQLASWVPQAIGSSGAVSAAQFWLGHDNLPGWDWAGLAGSTPSPRVMAEHSLVETEFQLGPNALPLKEADWNQVTMARRDNIIEITLNDELIFARPLPEMNDFCPGLPDDWIS